MTGKEKKYGSTAPRNTAHLSCSLSLLLQYVARFAVVAMAFY